MGYLSIVLKVNLHLVAVKEQRTFPEIVCKVMNSCTDVMKQHDVTNCPQINHCILAPSRLAVTG